MTKDNHIITLSDISAGKILTDIALISKVFWGYFEALIESWREALAINSKIIKEMMIN